MFDLLLLDLEVPDFLASERRSAKREWVRDCESGRGDHTSPIRTLLREFFSFRISRRHLRVISLGSGPCTKPLIDFQSPSMRRNFRISKFMNSLIREFSDFLHAAF